MPKLTRITNKIFGQNATAIGDNPQIGQFGSAKAGTYIGTTDVETIQELPAWSNGWVDAVTPQNQFPALPEMTAVHKVLSRQTAYLYQEGIPEYDNDTTFFKGSLVKSYSDENGVKLHYSKIDENINHPLTDTGAWEEVSLGGSGGLEIGDIGMSLYIDETKGKRRRLNGSILAINDNTRGFVDWLKSVVAITPSLATTEQNWQAEVTTSKFGQCGKFVINETAGTIRLPKVINIQGLTDLAQAGVRIAESLPNIKGHNNTISSALNKTNYSGALYSSNLGTDVPQSTQLSEGGHYKLNFDASRSSSTYQDNAPVQQEAIQYPYFIQIATGAETEVNIINDIELNNPFNLFDSKYSDHELFNTSWLRSTSNYYSKAVYVKAYEALQVEHNTSITIGSTVTLPSGTEYTKQGLSVKLSTETFTDYDFVLNTSDETFRLRIKSKQTVIIDEGEENGIGYCIWSDGYCEQWGGYTSTGGTALTITFLKKYKDTNYNFISNATIASAGTGTANWYGSELISSSYTRTVNSTHVKAGDAGNWRVRGYLAPSEMPQTNYLYFYVGETVQNANLIDAGRLTETKVSKSGDTMTGDLTVPYLLAKNSKTECTVDVQNTSVVRTVSPTTSVTTQSFRFLDANNDVMGRIGLERYTDGRQCMKMQVYSQNQETAPAFRIYVGTDGKATYSPVQLITTYTSGASGYNIWSNGYCEQWGTKQCAYGNTTVTFAKNLKTPITAL